jgi:hypothetical protein
MLEKVKQHIAKIGANKALASDFITVFESEEGQRVLSHLEKWSQEGCPCFDNVYKHYAKSGEQELIKRIKRFINIAKQK